MEAMILMEGEDRTIADLQAQLANLTSQVRQLSEKQPRAGNVAVLRNLQKDFERTEEFHSTAIDICNVIEEEPDKFMRVSNLLGTLGKCKHDECRRR
ncbi:unnamed protein product [Heligmosomoides polygyrus]|uniref:ALIX_LYPXL_bnd domain-containing protein n=1 Tax=Heligmosomoides polygyrus TaxID=6339 RepID=A0A183G7D3_HELPZ|nr:unnamed protein product [Heligmosomoides polygyrus]